MFAEPVSHVSFAVSLLHTQLQLGSQTSAVASIVASVNAFRPQSPYQFALGPVSQVYGTMLAFGAGFGDGNGAVDQTLVLWSCDEETGR